MNTTSKVAPIQSIYIPRMSVYTTEQDVAMEFMLWGPIVRIDFTPMKKKPGFVEDMTSMYKSAFVHFYEPIAENLAVIVQKDDEQSYGLKYNLNYMQEKYWIVLPNENPVQHTMMNPAQIVDNCRYLEQKVEQQQRTIDELKTQMRDIMERLHERTM
jgi:hypothetical protein